MALASTRPQACRGHAAPSGQRKGLRGECHRCAISQIGNGRHFTPAALLQHMGKDKKVRDGRITLILARDIGTAFISRDVDRTTLNVFLAAETAAAPATA